MQNVTRKCRLANMHIELFCLFHLHLIVAVELLNFLLLKPVPHCCRVLLCVCSGKFPASCALSLCICLTSLVTGFHSLCAIWLKNDSSFIISHIALVTVFASVPGKCP